MTVMTQIAQAELLMDAPSHDGGASRRARHAAEGAGCHGGKETLRDAAKAAGMTETLARYAKDYPVGPHDQPQSMCPAFGSLRVGCACAAPQACSPAPPVASMG